MFPPPPCFFSHPRILYRTIYGLFFVYITTTEIHLRNVMAFTFFFLCKKKGKRSLNFHTFVRCGNRTCRAFSNNLCTNKTVNGTFSLRNQTSFVILYAQHDIRVSFLWMPSIIELLTLVCLFVFLLLSAYFFFGIDVWLETKKKQRPSIQEIKRNQSETRPL